MLDWEDFILFAGAETVGERREKARQDLLLAECPEDLGTGSDSLLVWVQNKQMRPPVAHAYRLDDEEQIDPKANAYYCEPCNGWVRGEPKRRGFDTIRDGGFHPLSGSAGIAEDCRICGNELNKSITEQSAIN